MREKIEQLRADLIAYKASGKHEVSPDLIIVRLNDILQEAVENEDSR